jgi:hypothetical protein
MSIELENKINPSANILSRPGKGKKKKRKEK